MKIAKKLVCAAALLFSIGGISSLSAAGFNAGNFIYLMQTQPNFINDSFGDFADELGKAVPQAAVQQNVYADAYIGKLIPSVPPHFAVGLNAGFTRIDTSSFKKAAEQLGISGMEDKYYFPVMNADIRIGGIILPFDIGFSFMKLNTLEMDAMGCDLTVDFFTIAFDARYALLEEGLIKPSISVGLGYSYNSGSFSASESNAAASVDYEVHTIYTSVQVSKAINIPVVKIGFTPFVGLRALVSSYDNSYDWELKNKSALSAIDFASAIGFTSFKPSGSGKKSSDGFDFAAIQPQLFGGSSFNLGIVQITASICADLRNLKDDGLWSGALSLRIKI